MSRSTQRTDIPIYQRYSITVDEAVAYFMIGENRLRELVKSDRYADYLLWVGTTVRIKREQFEKFLDKTNIL
jgi:excisionase family DNA binding protein